MPQVKGAGWIRRIQEWVEREDEDRPEKLQLREVGIEGGSIPILEWPLKGDIDPPMIQAKVREFLAEAQDHANNSAQSGPIGLAVYGVDAEGSILGKTSSLRFFNDDPPDDLGSIEGPTPKGLLAQLMRHNEVMMQNSQKTASDTIRNLAEQNARMQSMFEEVEKRRYESMVAWEEAMTARHERELEIRKQEAKDEAQKRMFEQIAPMLKVVGPKLLGGLAEKAGLIPAGQGTEIRQLEHGSEFWHVIDGLTSVIHSLSETELMKLHSIIGTERAIALNELFEAAQKLKGEGEEDAREQAN